MRKFTALFFAATFVILALTFIGCRDQFTWLLETFPVIIGWPILLFLDHKYRVSHLVIIGVFLHGIILMIGGHYTYAEVPFGFWMEHTFGFARNHYDRIGHFVQGFFPALIFREVYLRRVKLTRGAWLGFIVITGCMAFSMVYEFIEWWTALATGSGADAFLGTQGDPWDTQWDMFFCTIGATVSILTMQKLHDRSLQKLAQNS
jgi:putative membrane protein